MFMWFVNQNNSDLLAQGSTSSFRWSDQQCSHSWSQAELGAVTSFRTDWSTDSTQLRNSISPLRDELGVIYVMWIIGQTVVAAGYLQRKVLAKYYISCVVLCHVCLL